MASYCIPKAIGQQGLFPKRTYRSGSLGNKLQKQFGKQCVTCTAISEEKPERDYIPKEIRDFVRVNMDSMSVESINTSGSALLRYVFTDAEIGKELDDSKFTIDADLLLPNIEGIPSGYDLVNSQDFGSYIYTTNCANIINLVAKGDIKYAANALSAAVEVDKQKKSALYAYEGIFRSPLVNVISERSSSTTELFLNLWGFYKRHSEYNNKAFFLKQFQGITIGRTTSVSQYRKLEASVGINISAGIANFQADGQSSFKNQSDFVGSDYQTFLYQNFVGNYTRQKMFEKLPSIEDISGYFKQLSYVSSLSELQPLMSEGNTHTHYVDIEGLPESYINSNKWYLANVDSNGYDLSTISLKVYKAPGKPKTARFEINGIPASKNFTGKKNDNQTVTVSYSIICRDEIATQKLELPIKRVFNTTAQPTPTIPVKRVTYSTTKVTEGKFMITWKYSISFVDAENPISSQLGKQITINNCMLNYDNKELGCNCTIVNSADKQYEIAINATDEFNYNVYDLQGTSDIATANGKLAVPLKNGGRAIIPMNITLEFPAKKPLATSNSFKVE